MILILVLAMAALFVAMRLIHQGLPLYATAITATTLASAWLLVAGKGWLGACLALAVYGLIRAALAALAGHDASSEQ